MDDAASGFVLNSPVGRLHAAFSDGALVRLHWTKQPVSRPQDSAAHRLLDQMSAYFSGDLRSFDIEINMMGTEFQTQVWQAMCAIPYGQTRTYGAVAQDLGSAARAVGMACGDNPIPIVVPCHRILAADGLGGFSGGSGPQTKTALLRLEGARLPAEQLDLPLG